MTYEDCKDIVAQKRGCVDWNDAITEEFDFDVLFGEAAELYLSSNTAKMAEEIEELKKQADEFRDEVKDAEANRDAEFERNGALEQQVKTLTEALEKIRDNNAVGGYSYNHMAMKEIAKEAISTINNK